MMVYRQSLVSFLFLMTLSIYLYAEDSDLPEPVVDKNEWYVGFSVLKVEDPDTDSDPDPALASAASLIPRLMQDELNAVDFHILTDRERGFLLQNAVKEKKLESFRNLSSLYSQRDRLFFNPNTNPASLRDLNRRIDEASLVLSYWKDNPGNISSVPEKLPVVFTNPPEGGALWNVDTYSPEAFRKEEGIDVLITGSILRVGNYFGVRISALNPEGEKVLWEGAADENDFEKISQEAAAAARTLILGRPWASITVQTSPPEAVISVNGKAEGVGLWSNTAMEPGPIVLKITAQGYSPRVLTEMLIPDEIKHLDISLDETLRPKVLISTKPQGASVRLGSIWMGKAPLSLDQPDRVMSLTLEKEGFVTRTVPLYPETERLTVPLDYVLTDPVEELAASRKKLYSSIAWFSFSIAPTIILLGISQNYANMNLAGDNPDDMDDSYHAYQLTYGLMWGSVAVNLGLLTNVLFKLSRYLKAAESLSD